MYNFDYQDYHYLVLLCSNQHDIVYDFPQFSVCCDYNVLCFSIAVKSSKNLTNGEQ